MNKPIIDVKTIKENRTCNLCMDKKSKITLELGCNNQSHMIAICPKCYIKTLIKMIKYYKLNLKGKKK